MSENQIEILGNREVELLEKNRKINIQKLFTQEGMDSMIAEIQKEAAGFTADITTKKGRDEIKSMAAKVARCKAPIKELAAELKEDSRRFIDGVNAQFNRYEKAMDDLRDEIRKPVNEIEEKEAAELKARQDRLAEIDRLSITRAFDNVEDLKGLLKDLEVAFDFEWGEFQFKAQTSYDEARKYLESEIEKGIKHEAEQAELKRLRQEAAEREQKDREAKIAAEAAEKAKREAEEAAERERKAEEDRRLKAEEDAKRAEAAKKSAEERAKEAERLRKEQEEQAKAQRIIYEREGELLALGMKKMDGHSQFIFENFGVSFDLIIKPEDIWNRELPKIKDQLAQIKKRIEEKAIAEAVEKERLRVEEEKRKEKEAAEKREANKRHRAKIEKEAAAGISKILNAPEIENGTFEEVEKKIIEAIANGEVPHVSINY